jgi:hypothetical protein
LYACSCTKDTPFEDTHLRPRIETVAISVPTNPYAAPGRKPASREHSAVSSTDLCVSEAGLKLDKTLESQFPSDTLRDSWNSQSYGRMSTSNIQKTYCNLRAQLVWFQPNSRHRNPGDQRKGRAHPPGPLQRQDIRAHKASTRPTIKSRSRPSNPPASLKRLVVDQTSNGPRPNTFPNHNTGTHADQSASLVVRPQPRVLGNVRSARAKLGRCPTLNAL